MTSAVEKNPEELDLLQLSLKHENLHGELVFQFL